MKETWRIDTTSKPGTPILRLNGILTLSQMAAFIEAHNAAVDGFIGDDYRVFCDLRGLQPLSPEAAQCFEKGKRHSDAQPNFQGSAVVVSSMVVALQHERTSVASGVMNTELITTDEDEAWRHLASIRRSDTETKRTVPFPNASEDLDQ